MALVLSLREGEDFYLNDDRLVVEEVSEGALFELFVERSGKTYTIDDASAEEVLPDVMISAGTSRQLGVARVAIDAPQDVLILRGDRYREWKGEA